MAIQLKAPFDSSQILYIMLPYSKIHFDCFGEITLFEKHLRIYRYKSKRYIHKECRIVIE